VRNGVRVNPHKKHAKPAGFIYEACLPLCCVSPSSVMIHRDLFNQHGLFDVALPACEDYDLWLRLSAQHRITTIPEKLITKYGGHADQLSHQYWGMDRFRIQALIKQCDNADLTPAQRVATVAQLRSKLAILRQGAEKRAQWEDVQFYEALTHQYC
jgi:GT2 family glycosyltransferase